MHLRLVSLALLLVADAAAADARRPAAALPDRVLPAASPPAAPLCSGDYADDLSGLSSRMREVERDPRGQYSYCLRTTAVYECLSYASDGTVRHARRTVTAHGTGFAYRRLGGESYLLTNEHIASWPAVTGEEHPLDDVPSGCKRVSETIRIVDDEEDVYEANDIALQSVVTDPALDMAVLKTRASLRLIPYRVGRSAALRVGNAVSVRGFPLGAFRATHVGKVVNAQDHDSDRDWDHVDFVVDALLSPGNSGSPVLALSCSTGEYELVGVYHAGYTRGSALNVVVAVDQLRDLMTRFQRRASSLEAGVRIGPTERELVRRQLTAPAGAPFFPLGALVASVRAQPDGTLWYEVYARSFPLEEQRLLLVEDLPDPGGFGEAGRIYVGNRRGLRLVDRAALDGDTQAQLGRIVTRLREDAVTTARYRAADPASRQGMRWRRVIERQRQRQAAADRDAVQGLLDLAEQWGPRSGDPVTTVTQALGAQPGPPRADLRGESPRAVVQETAAAPGRGSD